MGSARNRNARGEARRAELLSAGMRLLSEQGVERVTVGDLTKAVGVSKTLFYWYFRDIDHLVRDALVQGVDVIRTALASGLVGIDDPLQRLERRLRIGLELVEHDESVGFLLRADSLGWSARPEFASVIATGDDVLFDIVRDVAEGQAHGDIRDDVPAFLLAGCVRSVFADAVARHVRGQTKLALRDAIEAAIAFSLQGAASPSRLTIDEQRHKRGTAVRGL